MLLKNRCTACLYWNISLNKQPFLWKIRRCTASLQSIRELILFPWKRPQQPPVHSGMKRCLGPKKKKLIRLLWLLYKTFLYCIQCNMQPSSQGVSNAFENQMAVCSYPLLCSWVFVYFLLYPVGSLHINSPRYSHFMT